MKDVTKLDAIDLESGILSTNKLDPVPIWEKSNLTVEEAALYSGIGRNKIRELTESEDCDFVLWVGSKRLIKRKKFDEFIEKQYSI